ncbi:MAG: hypothetical protein MUP22_15630 [Desulfobacterales bacterium]|nr:hypothetical protein [Desulfobacterales bacterium]
MKNNITTNVTRVVIATGISSVVTQLLTIREFLTQFSGNEFIISLILFSWLIISGFGTLLAGFYQKIRHTASISVLLTLSILLVCLSPLQIIAIRVLRDVVFIHGTDTGFYSTFAFIFLTITPYALLIGFLLPYSLFVIRTEHPDYSGTRIYITDNIGDVAGGALFSFVLIYLVTPLQAIFLANLPLLVFSYKLHHASFKKQSLFIISILLSVAVLFSCVLLEKKTLFPVEGKLAHYQESRFGRISVHQDHDQFTLFQDGVPVFSNQNLNLAEEIVHYPLAQISNPKHILVISAEGGIMDEIEKYKPQHVDFLELDTELTSILFTYGLIKNINGLNVIHKDARVFLKETDNIYDAILINIPEPETFQLNRFYTSEFFIDLKKHLLPSGILSFSMEGFDNYLAEPQREKLSSLFNTVSPFFSNVLLIPGQRVFFLCADIPLATDIPASLDHKNISTTYIKGFFYGNITQQRIDYVNNHINPAAPVNTDLSPQLIQMMFSQWFKKFDTSPYIFAIFLIIFFFIYVLRTTKEAYVLFSTGLTTMGCEVLVIFAFQIFFGYIYFQIGLIVTVFLAGLLPGAFFGEKLQEKGRFFLGLIDVLLMILMALFIIAIGHWSHYLHEIFFLIFGFMVSLLCGFQFPIALFLENKRPAAVTRLFSSDLIGAAFGTLITSVACIPFLGIINTAIILILFKATSLIIVLTGYEKN